MLFENVDLKINLFLCSHWRYIGGVEVWVLSFSTSTPDGGE
jgi:hypothetical protein